MSPAPLTKLFQWSDDEEEASGYASSATISSVRMGLISANMFDNDEYDLCRLMEAQEQIFRDQQEALDNIQQRLPQLLVNRNINDTGSNHNKEDITIMNVLRLRNRRKAPQSMLRSLNASMPRLHP